MKQKNKTYPWIYIDIIALLLILTNLFLGIIQLRRIESYPQYFNQLNAILNKEPIFNLKYSDSSNEDQVVVSFSSFKGTTEGCDCRGSNSTSIPSQCRGTICRKTCSASMKKMNCSTIEPLNEINITIWRNKQLYKNKEKGNYTYKAFLENAVSSDKECANGYKQCGILDSLGNKLCLEEEEECPLNFLLINNEETTDLPYDIETIKLDEKKYLHYSHMAINLPIIIDFQLSDNEICINPEEYGSTSNSSLYILDHYKYYGCNSNIGGNQTDNRYFKLDNDNKYSIYSMSSIVDKLASLPEYPFKELNATESYLYYTNYHGMNKELMMRNQYEIENIDEYEKIFDSVRFFGLYGFILICFEGYCYIGTVIARCYKKKGIKSIDNLLECLVIIASISVLIFISVSLTYLSKIPSIIPCGDNITNVLFNLLSSGINLHFMSKLIILISSSLIVIGYSIDLIYLICNNSKESIKKDGILDKEGNIENDEDYIKITFTKPTDAMRHSRLTSPSNSRNMMSNASIGISRDTKLILEESAEHHEDSIIET